MRVEFVAYFGPGTSVWGRDQPKMSRLATSRLEHALTVPLRGLTTQSGAINSERDRRMTARSVALAHCSEEVNKLIDFN